MINPDLNMISPYSHVKSFTSPPLSSDGAGTLAPVPPRRVTRPGTVRGGRLAGSLMTQQMGSETHIMDTFVVKIIIYSSSIRVLSSII